MRLLFGRLIVEVLGFFAEFFLEFGEIFTPSVFNFFSFFFFFEKTNENVHAIDII